MTHDEVSKACVPTGIRKVPEKELDGFYNAAHSHLRDTDPGVIRQMEACIRAISDERARRRAKWSLRISIFAVIVSAISVGFAVRASLRPDLMSRVQALEFELHSYPSRTPPMTAPATLPPPAAPTKP